MPVMGKLRKAIRNKLFTGAIWGLLAKVTSGALGIVLTFVVARTLDMEDAGVFFLGINLVVVLAVFGRFGYDTAILRFSGAAWYNGEFLQASGYLRRALRRSTFIALAGLAVWLAVSRWIEPYLVSPSYPRFTLSIYVLAMPAFALIMVVLAGFRAFGQPGKGNMEYGSTSLVVSLALAVAFYLGGMDVWKAGWLYVGSMYAVLMFFLLVAWGKGMLRAAPEPPPQLAEMERAVASLFIVALMQVINARSAPIILGLFAPEDQVAILAVATRVAALISLALMAANSVLPPKFAQLYQNRQFVELEALAFKASLLTTLMVLPAFVVIFFYSDFIMGLFGSGYHGHGHILLIMTFGQMINAMTGSVGFLLSMSGHQKVVSRYLSSTTLLSLFVNTYLAYRYGVIGVAAGATGTMAVQNLLLMVLVYKKLDIRLFVLRLLPSYK